MPSNQERNVTNFKHQQRFMLGLLINTRFEHFNTDVLYHRVSSSFYSTAIKKKKITESLKGIHIDFPVCDSDWVLI